MNAPFRPMDRDQALQAARALRADGRVADAICALERLKTEQPRFSRLHQELGHCYVAVGDASAAVASLREAVRLNPALPASWDMLEQLHRLRGEAVDAAAAARRVAALRSLPLELVAANSLYADGDLDLAEDGLRGFLGREPRNAGALRLLARIRHDCDAPEEAEGLLRRALVVAPDFDEARLDLALVLLQQQKHAQARDEAERVLQRRPDDRDALKALAAAYVGVGDYEPAVGVYDRLLRGASPTGPEAAELLAWRAHALKITDRLEEAILDYRAAIEAEPDYGVAWFGLANLKTYRFGDGEIARMRHAEARDGLAQMDGIYLDFALGKALEDRGDYAGSWRFYERGAALRRRTSRHRPDAVDACVARTRASLTLQAFAAREGWGVADAAPIFVVGLPRSGSTLVEQILASHPRVEGTQELGEIGRYAREICGHDPDCGLPLRPDALLRLDTAGARALGERYLAETRVYRRLGRPVFIDKMPNNFWHVGLIQMILPNATIIDVRREPMACGFSNFKQLFGSANQEFTYDLDDFARYYRSYLALMRHWAAAAPGRVTRVHYEDLVDDLETGVRRLLDRCGLSFDPACLAFHQTRRSVRTPSSEQVRRPIDRKGLDHWRNYAPWLGGLRASLGDAIDGYRD